MSQRIRIRVVHNEKPDIRLYVTALIELARQKLAEEAAQAKKTADSGQALKAEAEPGDATSSEADHG